MIKTLKIKIFFSSRTLEDFLVSGLIEYLDVNEESDALIAVNSVNNMKNLKINVVYSEYFYFIFKTKSLYHYY